MNKLENFDLHPYNTMRLHSRCDVMYFPESIEELTEIVLKCQREIGDFHILSAGSNIIFCEHVTKPIINLMEMDKSISYQQDSITRVGASVRIQTLIRDLQRHEMGGIEYLYSVPASLGGLIYMNGGRGREWNMSISDYLITVDYMDLEDMKIHTYDARKSDFTYRHSPFQDMNVIILSATFRFKKQDAVETESLIKKRLEYSKKYLSADKPSCGTAFCKGNRYIFRMLRGMKIGGAMFSRKTSNWISNVDNATYDDVCKLIKRVQIIHKLFFCSCQPEIKIIKE